MQAEYNSLLLGVSFVVATMATLAVFTLCNHIYKSPAKSRNTLLVLYSVIAGSGLWLNHLLLNISSFKHFKPTYSPVMMIVGWFLAIGSSYALLLVASKRELLPRQLLMAAITCVVLIFGMFYADWASNLAFDQFDLLPMPLVAAVLVSFLVAAGSTLIFYWSKTYQGQYAKSIKTSLAAAFVLSIFSIHVAYNQAIVTNVGFSEKLSSESMLGYTIALAFLLLFSAAFSFSLLYEKIQGRRLLSQMELNNESANMPLDSLTQLPNRKAFDVYLKNAPKRCARSNKTFAVAYVDLDHFKPINDQYGHHVGDSVLTVVAERLNAAVRSCDFVARIGGDEFAVLFEDISSDEDIIPVAQRIVDSVKEPFWTLNHHVEVSCSIGIAIYPRDGDIKTLMLNADAAMYKSKEGGKNQYKFFDKEIEQASNQMRDLQTDLQAALDQRQLSLMFQPKVDCRSLSPVGAEALIRWHHPRRGVLLPRQFLPAAERFGLIQALNQWVLEECCRTLAKANREGVDLRLSMNLASQQFRNSNLVDDISKMLKKYHLRNDQLIFEIKELAAVRNKKQFTYLLQAFKQANIKVSLDDFGSQSFSLDALQQLDVSEVKLDRSFISQIDQDSKMQGLLDAVIRLAGALNLNIVACGVENESQHRILRELGCNHMQGFLFSKPVTSDKLLGMFDGLYNKFENTGRFEVADYQSVIE